MKLQKCGLQVKKEDEDLIKKENCLECRKHKRRNSKWQSFWSSNHDMLLHSTYYLQAWKVFKMKYTKLAASLNLVTN